MFLRFGKIFAGIGSIHTPVVKLIQSQLTTLQPNTNYGGTDRKQLMYICSGILDPVPFTLITLFIPFKGGNYHWSLKPSVPAFRHLQVMCYAFIGLLIGALRLLRACYEKPFWGSTSATTLRENMEHYSLKFN